MDRYPLCVEVLHSLGDGVEHSAGLPLREELLSEDLIQQLPSLKQLGHQENRAAIVIHLQNTEINAMLQPSRKETPVSIILFSNNRTACLSITQSYVKILIGINVHLTSD